MDTKAHRCANTRSALQMWNGVPHTCLPIHTGVRVFSLPVSTGPGPRVTEMHPASQHKHSVCGILRTLASTQKVAPGSHLWDSTVPQLGTKPPPVLSQRAEHQSPRITVPYPSVSPSNQSGQTPIPTASRLPRFPGPRGEPEQQCPSPHIPITPIPLALFPFGNRPGLLQPAECLTPTSSVPKEFRC